jgi:hypothetical protein
MKDELKSRTPDAIVNPGDCVRTHRAVSTLAKISLFILMIARKFTSTKIDAPVVMYEATNLTYIFNHKKIYSILDRVRKHHGLSKIDHLSVKYISDNYTKGGPGHSALIERWRLTNVSCQLFGSGYAPTAIGRQRLAESSWMLWMMPACWGILGPMRKLDSRCVPLLSQPLRHAPARREQDRPVEHVGGLKLRTHGSHVKREALKIRAADPCVSQAKLADEIKFKFDNEVSARDLSGLRRAIRFLPTRARPELGVGPRRLEFRAACRARVLLLSVAEPAHPLVATARASELTLSPQEMPVRTHRRAAALAGDRQRRIPVFLVGHPRRAHW